MLGGSRCKAKISWKAVGFCLYGPIGHLGLALGKRRQEKRGSDRSSTAKLKKRKIFFKKQMTMKSLYRAIAKSPVEPTLSFSISASHRFRLYNEICLAG